jgi:excinuclease ABC subunit C
VRTGALISDRRWGGCPWRDTSQFLDKPCLEYHIDRCSGPCIGAVEKDEYSNQAKALRNFLEGRSGDLLKDLESRMKEAAVEMKFEDAAKLRDQIEAVKSVVEKQQVVSLANEDYDALGCISKRAFASVVVLVVRGGKMLGDQHFFLQNIEGRGEPEVLSAFVRQHYEGPTALPHEILVPHDLEDEEAIKEWLSDNAARAVDVRRRSAATRFEYSNSPPQRRTRAARTPELQRHCQASSRCPARRFAKASQSSTALPRRIECFDISTVQGSFSSVRWWSSKTAKR